MQSVYYRYYALSFMRIKRPNDKEHRELTKKTDIECLLLAEILNIYQVLKRAGIVSENVTMESRFFFL